MGSRIWVRGEAGPVAGSCLPCCRIGIGGEEEGLDIFTFNKKISCLNTEF